MKRKILVSCLLLFAVNCFQSCKKESGGGKTVLLSKVYRNGLLENEYLYDAQKRPYRMNRYSISQGQSSLVGYQQYLYNGNGQIREVDYFDKGNEIQQVLTLTYSLNGELTRLNDGSENGSLLQYYIFQYNADGTLSRFEIKSGATNKVQSEAIYSYADNKKLAKQIRNSTKNGSMALLDSTTYSTGKALPSHWSYFEMLPVIGLLSFNRLFFDMMLDGSFSYRVSATPEKNTYSFTNKVYNSGGYLINQRIALKTEHIGPVITTNDELTYEYVEL
jgi:hypothetical protein